MLGCHATDPRRPTFPRSESSGVRRRGFGSTATNAPTARRPRSHRSSSGGAPEEIRIPDPQIRSLVLYPAELRARGPKVANRGWWAGGGDVHLRLRAK